MNDAGSRTRLLARCPGSARIVEVGPRDGLQNEPQTIPTTKKIAFVNALSTSGLRHIEVASFVSPRRVPQLADGEEVFRTIEKKEGVTYTALVPNERGLGRALQVGVQSIALFTAASETFNRKNIGASIAESFERFRPVLETAKREGLRTRGYISTAFVCPFEGPIPPAATIDIASRFRDSGVTEISLGDTTGAANPRQVATLLEALAARHGLTGFALHLHDTYRRALANALVGLHYGIEEYDASAGGLGGCPFAPGAKGNVATEDIVEFFEEMGVATGVDAAKVRDAVQVLRA